MAVSPIGNVTYVNQNAQLGSLAHANAMPKADFTLTANMQDFTDKLRAIQEVSPAPKSEAIDANAKKEQEKQKESKEHKVQNAETSESSQESNSTESTHILNILA